MFAKKSKNFIQKNNKPDAPEIDDIRIGLKPPSLFRNPLKWFSVWKYRREHKRLHNENALFYTTSPMLLEGLIKAFNVQLKKREEGKNLLDGYAYWEFGVFKGFSLWFAEIYARQSNTSNFYFYGFDSFEGLPKSKVDGMKPAFGKGHYTAGYEFVVNKLKELGVDFEKVKLYKGFYSRKLFESLKKNNTFLPISICVIDCDVYESTVEVLDFIKDFLVSGSILLFDDYHSFYRSDEHSERKALREFEEKNPNFKKKHLFNFGWHGAAFEVINI
jgi:hypothetical protein